MSDAYPWFTAAGIRNRPEDAMRSKENEINDAAFRRLEDRIKATYSHGQFVAFSGGEIVADASDFDELHAKLKAAGKDPYQAFVIQAGHKYPQKAIIL